MVEQAEIRRCVVDFAGFEGPSISVGTEAAEILGYSMLAQVSADVTERPIAKALHDLEIEILNRQDVDRYKGEHRVEVARKQFEEWVEKAAKDASRYEWDTFTAPNWARRKISEYKEPIPEFVLAKAIQIKKALPECQIMIEFLTNALDPFLVVQSATANTWDDPAERYYVEVWEEPKFEGRLRG